MSFFDEVDSELTSRLSSDCMSVYSYLSDVLSFFLRSGAVSICRQGDEMSSGRWSGLVSEQAALAHLKFFEATRPEHTIAISSEQFLSKSSKPKNHSPPCLVLP
ncbi:unnamed protein product [Cladocopium goreaui]|uniref:Uncharacterized protein n=1 Tax=Cladocopium goreaui TaxID=2562237 RepID=A0A9P1CNF6_9DINO|nr:unnamed protein product [Cladocopium goreaui]